jgi:hypothetical protein
MDDPTRLERMQLWKDSLHYWSHYPWRGTGLGTFRDYYPEFKTIPELRSAPYAHNEILNFACEMGGIGLLLLGWLVLAFFKNWEFSRHGPTWVPILTAIGVHSLVDFNLHYPPILILFVFSVCVLMPVRDVQDCHSRVPSCGFVCMSSLFVMFVLMLLPGMADFLFWKKNAVAASRLDPFNAVYWFERGTFQDLQTAMKLEPRNVWFHRAAARFWIFQWEQSKNPSYLQSALQEYEIIGRLAPNVIQFQKEFKELIELTKSSVSVIKMSSLYGDRHH